MKILKTPAEFREWRRSVAGSVGFVPTMGALHDGHATLLRRCRAENDVAVLSVFVNPTQFNDPTDFEKYPLTWDADVALAEREGVDAIFAPAKADLYPDDYKYRAVETDFSRALDGAARPGHFDGVLTVVMKLFNVVRPHRAYFGEKDYQQLQLVRGMASAFFMDLEVVPVPTVRAADGLALSSRNLRLTPAQRELAPLLHKVILSAKSAADATAELTRAGFRVDAIEDFRGRRFAAAFLGDVRLIDNVEL